ncbi:hypothetical protein CTI12_AA266730 [Artemisia annua]|uniref:Uncharacterized protein n=1 Tax=Artemisia annua TaxID=35608 RepID=A0A2U1NH46_ARTAN|nr:hypothetical protein CTI12_AA266730 [Artemisia annua]
MGPQNFEDHYPLMKALVTSKRPEDIQRGIEMIQGEHVHRHSLLIPGKKKTYLFAVGYFRSGDHPKSTTLVDTCLEIKPDCWKALSLKEVLVVKEILRLCAAEMLVTLHKIPAFGYIEDNLSKVATLIGKLKRAAFSTMMLLQEPYCRSGIKVCRCRTC